MERIQYLYKDYAQMPYISKSRNVEKFLKEIALSKSKLVPKRNMERLENGLLPGDVILLWRVAFGTYTTETVISKYFEYSYGIDAKMHIDILVQEEYVSIQTAYEAMEHLPATLLKSFLKQKQVTGLSKLTKDSAMDKVKAYFTENELGELFSVRGYVLTDKGEKALLAGQSVVDRHPKKKY